MDMNLAALLIPPSLDAKQALRLRRFGLAALSYALGMALVAVAWMFGVLPASAALEAAAAFLAINTGLYAVIRSGFNLRFDDPSLTRFQILTAITVLMYIVYRMDDGRNIALFGCFVVFLFGIYRLNAREFAAITLYTLAAYALVINLLMHWRPQAIPNVAVDWMSWLVLAGWLPWFGIIGGHMNTLRRRMRESEIRFRSLTEMSSDFYWETDAEHRLKQRSPADKTSLLPLFRQGAQIGERRWEIPYLSPDEAGWQAHRAVLDAHLPFRHFELSRLGADGTERYISISGNPVFDASGAFTGYRGVGTDISERRQAEEALRASDERNRTLLAVSPDGIWIHSNGRIEYANDALVKMLGYESAQDFVGRTIYEFFVPEFRMALRERVAKVVTTLERAPLTETTMLRRDTSRLEVETTATGFRQGDVIWNVSIIRDITERKRAEQALRESAKELRLFAENIPAMTSFYDSNLCCRFANKAYAACFERTLENIIGKHLREVVGAEVYREIEGHVTQVLQGHPVTYQRTRKLPNGEPRNIEVRLLPHIGDQGKVLGFFAVMTDITEHKLTEERIRRVAHHDGLTGLPNRLLFNDRLEQAISLANRDSRQFALLYLDLDKFKPVNDTLGHAAGDDLLQAVAERIRHQVRESDTVARVGGDEFTVILNGVARREDAEAVAKKIIASLAAPFQLGSQKQSVEIGTSIGIARFPADAQDADALVNAADAAMYSAKQVGSRFRFAG